MATYKVIQDIEAEDKLLGPLTLKQFIYAIIVVVCGFIAFKLSQSAWYLALPFLPPMLFFGTLAVPFGRDQPTEVWLVAKFRFLLKPRRRIWDQSGQLDYVTITVPKKIDPLSYTNNLTQTEVKSRLKALSETIDSRGWAVKNVGVNLFAQPSVIAQQFEPPTDRLVEVEAQPKVTATTDVSADEDILDEKNNPVAQQLDQMISASTQAHRKETLKKMQQIREHQAVVKQVKYDSGDSSAGWFMRSGNKSLSQSSAPDAFTSQNFSASTAGLGQPLVTDGQAVFSQTKPGQFKPAGSSRSSQNFSASTSTSATGDAKMTVSPDPAILGLANNDDLTVATIARQADQKDLPDSEVTVSLH
jgi:hypothetical protein